MRTSSPLLRDLSVLMLMAGLCVQAVPVVAGSTNGLPWLTLLLGDSNSGSSVDYPVYASTYETQVANYKAKYGMSAEWESWMIANKSRYKAVFDAARTKPSILTVSFRYETAPIAYNPPWTNESEHMAKLSAMASGVYVGYTFSFVFNGNTSTSYANAIAGTASSTSYCSGKNVYLYYETIFNHEFGHAMKLLHHYDLVSEIGTGKHMPPGETQCLMDRNSSLYCSACSTALGIAVGIPDSTESDAIISDILSRYPY